MADAYTEFLNLTKPEVGGSRDAWGDKWNANATTLDAWAKATDALAKHAIQDNKDGLLDGALSVTKKLSAKDSIYLETIGKSVLFGPGGTADGAIFRAADRSAFFIVPAGDSLRVLKQSDGSEVLRVAPNAFNYLGQGVWYAGNFDPASRALSKNSKIGNGLTIEGNGASGDANQPPYLSLVNVANQHWRALVSSDKKLYFQDGDTADAKLTFDLDGSVWTKQFGDLNTRIETRAKFYADDRLATARAEYGQAYQKTGGAITGPVSIVQNSPIFDLVYPNVVRLRQVVDANATWILRNGDSGNNYFYVTPTGNVWTAQFGDLGARIEARAQAFADDRLNTATARINNKSARLALIGDVGTTIGVSENYSGGVITGIGLNTAGSVTQVRYRQLQMSDSNGQWYVCGYFG